MIAPPRFPLRQFRERESNVFRPGLAAYVFTDFENAAMQLLRRRRNRVHIKDDHTAFRGLVPMDVQFRFTN